MNDARTNASICAEADPARRPPRPTRYEIIDRLGFRIIGGRWQCTDCDATFHRLAPNGRCACGSGRVNGDGFASELDAAEFAQKMFPDQEQDEEHTGHGWDVAVVGADRQ